MLTLKERGRFLFGTVPVVCDDCKPDSVRPDFSNLDGHFSR